MSKLSIFALIFMMSASCGVDSQLLEREGLKTEIKTNADGNQNITFSVNGDVSVKDACTAPEATSIETIGAPPSVEENRVHTDEEIAQKEKEEAAEQARRLKIVNEVIAKRKADGNCKPFRLGFDKDGNYEVWDEDNTSGKAAEAVLEQKAEGE